MPEGTKSGGGDHLCSLEMQLWGIVYTVALRWNALVLFQWKRMRVPKREDCIINFFVPKDATHRYEICTFIEGHLKKMRREPEEDEKHGFFPGAQAFIYCTTYTFDGASPEIPAETSTEMFKGWVQKIMMDIGTPKRQSRIVGRARQRLLDDPEFAEKLLRSMLPSSLEELMEGDDD